MEQWQNDTRSCCNTFTVLRHSQEIQPLLCLSQLCCLFPVMCAQEFKAGQALHLLPVDVQWCMNILPAPETD